MLDPVVWQDLWHRFLLFLPRVALSGGVFVIFWFLGRASQRVINHLARFRSQDTDLIFFMARAAHITLLVFGTVTALGTLGIDVTALVAGLGLTGFALGFALKDILSNALSGILIIIYKPFKLGNQISVTNLEGKISEINLRYTVLEAEGQIIFVPNANLLTNAVIVHKEGLPSPAGSSEPM
jgi:small-conductance mechanosensitive channel